MLKILYLVPNLSDPAVERRLLMLKQGGAEAHVAGFHRGEQAPPDLPAASLTVLGNTADGRFAQRLSQVALSLAGRRLDFSATRAEVVIARNLEMLPLAWRVSRHFGNLPVVYECLDIHRLMLREDMVGRAMRAAERRLVTNASALITSSPAFVREYFAPYGQILTPTWIIENKVLTASTKHGANPILGGGGSQPFRIGWFGALRCRRSLDLLSEVLPGFEGRYELVMRGRPALTEFDGFHARVEATPHCRYEGPYKATDLPDIYSQVHLCWAIDMFEAGQNSQWLLPNRIYEGCLNGAVPIALEGTETARFLTDRGVGIILPDTEPETLRTVLETLDQQSLRHHALAVSAIPEADLRVDKEECRKLVERLSRLGRREPIMLEAA